MNYEGEHSLLAATTVGLALIEPGTLKILHANRQLAEWFPGAVQPGAGLLSVFPDFDTAKFSQRLERARPFGFERELNLGRRRLSLELELTKLADSDPPRLMLEARDITKQKQLQYMSESYGRMVEQHVRELAKEKERVERLLLNIMPRSVYDEWRVMGVTTPQRFDEASVLMLDFVGFTEMSVSWDPPALIAELNDIFTAFDRIVEQFGCERLKTIGDAYVAVSGVPEPAPDHARNIARVALRFLTYLERRNASHQNQWRCRIGINSGSIVGSIVGVQKYVYDIFGPGINLAARLEAKAEPMEIVASQSLAAQIADRFLLEDKGEVELRGFGRQRIYRLLSEAETSKKKAKEKASAS